MKIGVWIDERISPLHEMDDERYCKPNPYNGGDNYEFLMLWARFKGEEEWMPFMGELHTEDKVFYDRSGYYVLKHAEDNNWAFYGFDDEVKRMVKRGDVEIVAYFLIPETGIDLENYEEEAE